ncbi:formate--tetrahydrofolate ligase [Halorubrum sp. SD683]|uniref:formate--tetrahydrofolate ligase n=1 Tax=Halorubrum sp. SD683 TaxID=1855873 RepID=UPI00117B15EE
MSRYFAGTNSILADELGLRLGDYLVTEAGFVAALVTATGMLSFTPCMPQTPEYSAPVE